MSSTACCASSSARPAWSRLASKSRSLREEQRAVLHLSSSLEELAGQIEVALRLVESSTYPAGAVHIVYETAGTPTYGYVDDFIGPSRETEARTGPLSVRYWRI